MESAPSVLELGALLVAAVAAGWLARRLGLPAVVGYLVLGIAVSPFTPGYVADRHQLQLLADVGVVLLLFEVGIEVDVWRLRREHGEIIWAAPVQVLATTGISAAVVMVLGLTFVPAVVVGLAIALSSSVAIVNITRSRRRTTDPSTERAMLGWSVVQDVTGVVLAAIVIVALRGESVTLVSSLIGYAAFAAVAVVTALVLPRVLRQVRQQPDLFLLLSVGSGLVIAGVGAVVFGVPLALAAFIGGLVITEDPISREARRQLLPFRDLFAVLFFVAIGALIDPDQLIAGAALAPALHRPDHACQGAAGVPVGEGRQDRHPTLAAGRWPGPDGRVQLRSGRLTGGRRRNHLAGIRGDDRRRRREHRGEHDRRPAGAGARCRAGGCRSSRVDKRRRLGSARLALAHAQ